MTYTKVVFARALKKQLASGYNPIQLARWAYITYLDHANDIESGLYDEMMKVASMEEGAQFEMSQEEIEELAENLGKC